MQVKDLKIWDSTQIYDTDRISRATHKGMNTKAHDVGTPEACSGSGLWKIRPSQSRAVTCIVWTSLYRTRPDTRDLAAYK
jgi:hypothetical protein